MRIAPIFFTALFYLIHSAAYTQISFVENKGQWHYNILYQADLSTGNLFIEQKGFSVLLHHPQQLQSLYEKAHGHQKLGKETDTMSLSSHFYRVSFLQANEQAKIVSEKVQQTYNNYFIGNDPSKWTSRCRLFQSVRMNNIYPRTDIRYYHEGEQLKYDWILSPGANPYKIIIKYEGVEKLFTRDGNLIIVTSIGEVKELYPYSYQQDSITGQRKRVPCKYVVKNNIVTFDLGKYDPTQMLIIDPSIIFSSFTGSTSDNWGYTATPGPDGSLFAGGVVFGNGYPASPGAYQTSYSGGTTEGVLSGHDIAIFKFSSNGANREYATYLGGSGNEQPHSMISDAQGNLIMAGRSFSTNYPTTTPLIGTGGNNDIVITKLNATGTAMIGSVRIGGSGNDGVNIRSKYVAPDGADRLRRNYGDDARSEVILDASNNILLASCTQSANFPVRGASLNASSFGGGLQDGLLLKFNADLSVYQYGSFLGGTGDDACFVTGIHPQTGNIYVAGGTTSNNLPGNTSGVIYPSFRGGQTDGFVTQIRADLSGIVKTTYLGTSGIDIVYGLKFDRNGYPYVMGTTTGNWPVLNAAYSIANSAQFISKLQPDLSAFVYSTVFGTGSLAPNISPIGFLVDRCENVYVTGWGGGLNVTKGYSTGTTSGLPLLNPLSGIGTPDGEDLYFFVLQKNATALLFASNFGQFRGNNGDHVDGGTSRFDENGIIYQAICANCNGGATFPTTPGVWRRTNGSSNCNEAAVKVEMDFTGVSAAVRPTINAVVNDTAACVPFRVDFTDTLLKCRKIYWDFGNGQRDTTLAPNNSTFTNYTAVGVYRVRMIAEDSSTCNVRDTSYLYIKAGNNRANLDFSITKNLPCTNLQYSFNNLSVPASGNFGQQSFTWNFGDGSPEQISYNATHNYGATGIYTVTLALNDTNYCNSPDTKIKVLNVNPLVKALFSTPATGCIPYRASFTNLSGTSNVTWQFSDGTSTNVENPIKVYNIPGTYQVRLIARDPNTCNQIDTSAWFTITVSGIPNAQFSWQPNPPVSNTPTIFTNQSTGAVQYNWSFGDGETSTTENPSHQYITTGNFIAQLVATNIYGCTDTFKLNVRTLIDPLLDVPNAFTPGKFGENAVIKVKGFGVGKLDWKIYNRWGQLLFQSNSIYSGWDGTYKGKLQPMDVYVYTLDAELTNGQKIRKTGDITLLQ